MAFKFKDLMVNVAPAAGAAKVDPQYCFDPSFCQFGSCGYQSYCGLYSGCGVYTACGLYSACGYPSFHCRFISYLPQFEAQAVAGPGPQGAQAAAAGPAAQMCPAFTLNCVLNTTATFTCQPCSFHYSGCFTGSCGFYSCHITIRTVCPEFTAVGPGQAVVPDPTAGANQLAAMKAQLTEALAEIDKQQKALDESLRPQSVAEVEQLQEKMKEALSELDKRKAELQKKPEKPGK